VFQQSRPALPTCEPSSSRNQGAAIDCLWRLPHLSALSVHSLSIQADFVHTPPWLAFVAQLADNIKHFCPARRHQKACGHEAAEAEDVEATLRTCRTTCTRTIAAMRMTRSSMLLWPPRRRPFPHDSLLRNMPLDPGQCVHRMTICSPSRVWLYIVHIYIYMYIYV